MFSKFNFVFSIFKLGRFCTLLNINKKNNSVINFAEKPNLGIWFNIGYILISDKFCKIMKNFKKFENFLDFLTKKKLMKSYKHLGRHITVNTVTELETAKIQIKKFV